MPSIPVAAEMLGLAAAARPEPLMRWDEKGGRRGVTEHQEKGRRRRLRLDRLGDADRHGATRGAAGTGDLSYAEYCRRVAAGLAAGLAPASLRGARVVRWRRPDTGRVVVTDAGAVP